MFGRKSQKIELLEAQLLEANKDLDAMTGVMREAEPFIPLAMELRDHVNDNLAGYEPDSDDGLSITEVQDAAVRDVMRGMVGQALERMDPTDFIELYVERCGDDGLREQLEAQKERKTKDFQRASRLEDVRRSVEISGLLKLDLLDEEEVLTIGLFRASEPQHAHAPKSNLIRDSRHLRRMLTIRLLDPSEGEVEVLEDAAMRNMQPIQGPLDDHLRGHIGSLVVSGDESFLEPALTVHSRISYDFDGEVKTPNQIVGYVQTRTGEFLMDGS